MNYCKQIIAFFFLIAFLAQTMSKQFVAADYYLNTSKYAKNCVNKAQPKMNCNGKCQAMKRIQEAEKKEQQNQERKVENKYTVLSSKSFPPSIQLQHQYLIEKFYSIFSSPKTTSRSYKIFHPPSCFVLA